MTVRTVSADDLETMARAAHADIELPGPEGGWAVAVINGHRRRAWVASVSIERLRRAASLMREHGARGLAWDGDYAADKGWLAPPVALAVADWLEHVALVREAIDGVARRRDETPGQGSDCFLNQERRALAVANAYLQETP